LIRGLNRFLAFPLLTNVGMFSNHMVMALAQGSEGLLRLQAVQHQIRFTPPTCAPASTCSRWRPTR